MAYFPMFIELKDRPCLIVGGGEVARRKAEKLRPYGADIRVVAPEFSADFPGCTLLHRPYIPGDEAGMALVIAATDDRALNHAISRSCQDQHIPVNVVDDRACCTFLFPSLIERGPLSIGISTGGASPTAARWVKEQIAPLVPDCLEQVLPWLEAVRPRIKGAIPDERARAKCFAALFAACLERGRPLTEEELEGYL